MKQDQTPRYGSETRKTLAVLGALCFFLSAIEYMIPKPLPFMRIGVANLPLTLGVDILPFPAFLALAGLKIIGQALISGTLFSYIFLFSCAGTILSALSMYAARRVLGKDRVSFVGINTLGAGVSNLSQLVLARVFVFGAAVRYMAPPFLAAGLAAGVALGFFCEAFARRSRWYEKHKKRRSDEQV